jgi:iron complex outermembrane receptor protein
MLGDQTQAVLSASYSSTRRLELIQQRIASLTSNKFYSLGARVSHDTGWGVLSARVYRNRADVEVPQELNPEGLHIVNKVVVAAAEVLVRAGSSNTVRAGVEVRDNRFESEPGYPGATRYNVYAASGMWESVLSDALTFTLAGRLDHLKLTQDGVVDQPSIYTKRDFDRTITGWSLNSALLYKLDDASTLRAAIARGIQAPALFSLGSRLAFDVPGVPVPLVLSGNPALQPSILWSGEVGFTHVWTKFGRLELNAFYNRTKNVLSVPTAVTTPAAAPPAFPFILFAPQNVGSFEAFGLEASLSGAVARSLFWSANYTWTHARQDIRGNNGTSFDWPVALDRSTPRHTLKAQLSYEHNTWLGTVAARYTSATEQLVAVNGPLQLVDLGVSIAIDAKLSFKIGPRLTLEVAAENLTGSDAADLSPIASERRLRAGARVRF